MALEIDGIAKNLFEKIRARFEGISVGDIDAETTTDPAKARFFNFDYIDKMGNNFGNVTISLIDEESLKIYFGKNLSADLDEAQKAEWYDFLRDMRMFAMRNLLTFDTRDISRSNLNLKDIKQLSATEAPSSTPDLSVTESKLYGTTKTSYKTIAPGTRLIIRHTGAVDETIQGARSRKIKSIYIEDSEGQRFKSPFTHLGGSCALGRHVYHGGQINDEFASHIVEMVEEMSKLRRFVQGSKNKTFEDAEANDMIGAAKERYRTVHHILNKLKGKRGYEFYHGEWKPAKSLQDDIDLESLRKKFVQTSIDERLEDALPHVYKAYHAMKTANSEPTPMVDTETMPGTEPHLNEFEEWMDTISEGTWALPDSDMSVKKLNDLMSDVLVAGIDGSNATGALYDILGDDQLFDRIYDASRGSPEMDVRPIVFDWLQDHMPDVAQQLEANLQSGGSEEKPDQEPAPGTHEQPKEPAPQEESFMREGYYSVEADSPPFYIHTTENLEEATKHLQTAHKRGQTSATIYEIRVVNGEKKRIKFEAATTAVPVAPTVNNTQITEMRRLAGLK